MKLRKSFCEMVLTATRLKGNLIDRFEVILLDPIVNHLRDVLSV
jgi:hypothetical protein